MSRRRPTLRRVHRIRLAVAGALAVSLLLTLALAAHAYLTASGRGGASATVASLPAPTITRASPGSSSASLEWSAVTAPGSGTVTYYVTRDGGTPAGDCPAAASPRAVLSCTDRSLSLARHDYTVTAVWRSWTGRSATSSVTVTNGPATQLVFTTQPSATATGGTAFATQPVVTARDANGNTVTDYSGTVTLSIFRGGAAGAALTGCSATLVNGVTSFRGCAIDRSNASAYFLRARDGTLSVDGTTGVTVSAGAAAQLVFTTQPGNGTGGNELSTQPVVRAADAGGNLIGSSYTGTVTLSIVPGTGAGDARLSGCSSSRSSGITTFDNCEIDRAASGYRLRASDGSISGDSNAFNVTVGSTADIVFSTQPGGGATGGLAFPTQPVVTAVDAGGNTVTSYSSTVVLSIASGPSGADLDNCVGTRVVAVTTFRDCELDRAGTYVLRADDGPRDDQSASFRVDIGPVADLDFTISPAGATAGRAFTTQPSVAGVDAGGNTVTSYAGTVSLAIASGTGTAGATLSDCIAGAPSGGVIRFSGCSIDRSGSNYRLRAVDGSFTDDSSSFTVSAGAPAQLAFTTQPAGAIANASFGTQPAVTALDALGNVATSYSGTVSLAIKSGTGTAGASLSNCDGDETGGVTTFDDCEINRLGSGYVLRASDNTGLTTADSTAFDVTIGPAATLVLRVTSSSQAAGASNDLTITALDVGGNVATSYTGARSITFTGASRSPSGASPTVTDSSGTPVAFGSPTSITFTAGVARASGGANGTMVLRLAGSDDINIDDGPLDNDGDEPTVTITVGTAARLAWTAVNSSTGSLTSPCYFICTKSGAGDSATFQARVAVTDAEGNIVSSIGSNHRTTVSTPTSPNPGSGGRFSGSVTSLVLTFASSGSAITTSSFTFTNASGSWTTNTFRADPVSPDTYTAATATVNNN